MPEPTQITFTHKEIVELLLKKQGIHEGIWGLYVKFGLKALNVGVNESDLNPAAIITLMEIGLIKADGETNLSLDASKINPPARSEKPKKRKA